MRKNLPTIILILVFLTGLSLLLYPSVSDYWNSLHQSRAIAAYSAEVAELDNSTYDQLWEDAKAFNRRIASRTSPFELSAQDEEAYGQLLNVSGSGIMGYIEIPRIKCSLPIYHGVDEAVLQIAVGHLEWTSLPVGGEGTHCVISGHRGLPSAKLFTNLDQLTEGDIFMMRVLDEVLTYEVDQILIVEPDDMDALMIEPGKDYCTLVTCTPYGVNSHRLLVRGHRIETQDEGEAVRVTSDAMQIDPVMVAPAVAAPILMLLLVWLLIKYRKKK